MARYNGPMNNPSWRRYSGMTNLGKRIPSMPFADPFGHSAGGRQYRRDARGRFA